MSESLHLKDGVVNLVKVYNEENTMGQSRNAGVSNITRIERTGHQYGQLVNYFTIGNLKNKFKKSENGMEDNIVTLVTDLTCKYLDHSSIINLVQVSRRLYQIIHEKKYVSFEDEAAPFYNALLNDSIQAYIHDTKKFTYNANLYQSIINSAPDGLNRTHPLSHDINTLLRKIISIGLIVGLISLGPELMLAILSNTVNENQQATLSQKSMVMMGSMVLSIVFLGSFELIQRYRASYLPSRTTELFNLTEKTKALKRMLSMEDSLLPTHITLEAKINKLERLGFFATPSNLDLSDIETKNTPKLIICDRRSKVKFQ